MTRRAKSGGVPPGRILLVLGGLMALTGPCQGLTLYDFGNPTAEEQQYIELINRARANPSAEGARLAATSDPNVLAAYEYFGVNLTMLQSEFNAIPVVPPLAPNASLTTAARGHSAWMLATATQSHYETNPANDPFERMNAAGYWWSDAGENIYAAAYDIWYGHAGFEVDWGGGTGGMQSPRGHRDTIHKASLREIGVGVVFGTNGAVGPQLVTQDFGVSFTDPTLGTGVAYYDLNANNFYDLDEGIAGLSVNVGGSGVTQYCTTAIGGGWVVPVPTTAGTRTVTFSGLSMNQTASLVVAASTNAKADLKLAYAPPAVTSSASAATGALYNLAFTAVGGASVYKWNRWKLATAVAENCENASSITTTTTGTYSVLNTTAKQQGVACFHLENSVSPGGDQTLQLSPLFYGQAAAALTFQSKIRYATASEQFKVQVKEEGGATWQDVFSQTGSGTAGESAYTLRSAPLTAMVGKPFRVRFVQKFNGGSYYLGSSGDMVGWFIDAINFTNVATLANNVNQTLGGMTGSFAPEVGTYLMSVTPVISGRDFPASWKTLTVTAGVVTAPAIATQPVSVSISSGSSATFSVGTSGSPPTFQWYAGNAGVTTNPVAGATANSFTTPALTATTSYWVRATNTAGTADSTTVTATVLIAPAITSQPVSVTINSGTTATFVVTASGSAPTYQWYAGNSGTITSPVAGATGSSFITVALTATTSYWVRVSNAVGTADSNTVTATVVVVAPVITSQPASIAIKTSTKTTLTVVATSGPAMTYQWYNGLSGVTTSKITTGGTSASYTTPTLATAKDYWVHVKNSAGGTNSNTAAVTIAVAPAITTQPVAVNIYSGNTAGFSVVASGTAPTYQWYVGSKGTTTNPVAGATSSSLTTVALTATTTYWVRVTNPAGSVDSNAAIATVTPKPTAGIVLGSLAQTYDGSAKFATATTTPSGLTVAITYNGSATAPTNTGTYPVTATINDANYQGIASGNLVISAAPAAFAGWAAAFESAKGLAAGTIANQPNADYDHDGRSNLLEYAFGASPVIGNDAAPRMPVVVADPTYFVMRYQRDTALTDLTFTPQACTALGTWNAPVADEWVSTSGTVQTRQAKIPRSAGTTVFIRLRVSQP